MTDHYELLGVSRSAHADDIQAAFRRLASQHHPDRMGGDVEKMSALNVAYRVLMDREERASYDRSLNAGAPSVILACVSATDYDEAKSIAEKFPLASGWGHCAFCDGAREVRVGGNGFWYRKNCPVCNATSVAEGS